MADGYSFASLLSSGSSLCSTVGDVLNMSPSGLLHFSPKDETGLGVFGPSCLSVESIGLNRLEEVFVCVRRGPIQLHVR